MLAMFPTSLSAILNHSLTRLRSTDVYYFFPRITYCGGKQCRCAAKCTSPSPLSVRTNCSSVCLWYLQDGDAGNPFVGPVRRGPTSVVCQSAECIGMQSTINSRILAPFNARQLSTTYDLVSNLRYCDISRSPLYSAMK